MNITPIIIPDNYSSNVTMTPIEIAIFIVILVWVVQVICVWGALFFKEIDKRRTLFWWHIPILPLIVAAIKKVIFMDRL